MQVIYLQHPHNFQKEALPKMSLAIGYFDGVHKGHQKVIHTAKQVGEEKGFKSGVMTFHPHPSVVLGKTKKSVQYITPLEEKLNQLDQLGIDIVFVVNFDEELARLEPQAFVDEYLIGLNVQHVVAGFDFSYGKMGKGSMETIDHHSRGLFTHTTIPKVTKNEEKVSSTLIRQKIANGNIQEAEQLLGRPFQIKGKVVEGDQRGRTIGYPTANVQFDENYLIPKVGVYAVGVRIDEDHYYGMANIGYKPTFTENALKPTLEVYIFDFSGNIYDSDIIIEMFSYIREEKKFSGIEELKTQLKSDEAEIRQFFATCLT
jgi:riboflavin kinase / FMN adenylyltransferase